MIAKIAATEEQRRRRVRRRQTADGAGAATAPRLRDPLGVKPPSRKPEPDSHGSGGGGGGVEEVVDPVGLVWSKLSARHQCFIDRWPPEEAVSEGEGGEQEVGSGPSPQVGRWERGWKGSAQTRSNILRPLPGPFFFLRSLVV